MTDQSAIDVSVVLADAIRLRDELAAQIAHDPAIEHPLPEAIRSAVSRLSDSVIRPLSPSLAARQPSTVVASPIEDWLEQLWTLTVDVTTLQLSPHAPTGVAEAAAALQDMIIGFSPAEGPESGDARLAQLAEISAPLAPSLQASKDGPYLLTNAGSVTNWLGERIPTRPQMALCRCGASAIKPLCDGSHAKIGFSSAKDPARVPDRRDTYLGQQITVFDNRGICQHAGLCTDRLPSAFRQGQVPFVAASGGRMDEIIRAVRDCPSGALSFSIDAREAREQTDFDDERQPAIMVTKDGPYRITGGIDLLEHDGSQVARNTGSSREHYALCRCGHSQNKPFCSGMHWYVDFHDPVPDADHEPTVFEWCGGLPALTRMTRLFYEKHVPADPLLAPLFATMNTDHPERVAAWLGEVFGGPKAYSSAYGGYSRMISQHLGKEINEDKRARWVELLQLSAVEAGMPDDPEFRSVFASYIEWGSRLAVENSTIGARPPEHMPMPHWEWHTAAGAPGSRVSALSPTRDENPPVVLPTDGEPVSYERHIKTMFRSQDQRSMSFAFNLWEYDDVKEHARKILTRLTNGTMPCDGAWPAERIAVFRTWLESDTPN